MLSHRIELLLILGLQLLLSGCAPAPPLDNPDMQVAPNLLEDGSISGVHLASDQDVTILVDSMVDEPSSCRINPDCVHDAQPCSAEMNCPDGAPCDDTQNCGMSPDVGMDCTDSTCVPMNMCEDDQDCPDMHRCENTDSGKRCILFETVPNLSPPDQGPFQCGPSVCSERQVCAPAAVAACTQRDCYGGSGAFCENNCECAGTFICDQQRQQCVGCLTSLQCDPPYVCLNSGQCGELYERPGENFTMADDLSDLLELTARCARQTHDGPCGALTFMTTNFGEQNLQEMACEMLAGNASNLVNTDHETLISFFACDAVRPAQLVNDLSHHQAQEPLCVSRLSGWIWLHACEPQHVPLTSN